jgi:hypothetical protein
MKDDRVAWSDKTEIPDVDVLEYIPGPEEPWGISWTIDQCFTL